MIFIQRRSYVAAELPYTKVTPRDFANGDYDAEIRNRIRYTVKKEQPITRQLLEKRIRESFGLRAFGRNLRKKYEEILSRSGLVLQTGNNQEVFWMTEPPDRIYYFRVRSGERNLLTQIPVAEVDAAIRFIMRATANSISKEGILEGARTILGFKRTSKAFMGIMEELYARIMESANY